MPDFSHKESHPQAPISPLRARYEAALANRDVQPDAAQALALDVLDKFTAQIERQRSTSGWLNSLLRRPKESGVLGLYLYGDVGRGKSMLMDMFFATVSVTKKRRVHFHQFMLEIHKRLHDMQEGDDILPRLAKDIARDAQLLCFDEFHVSNIADAMILGRLFQALFDAGVIIVATSNWPPDDLYKNGLQRERFFPFIDLIKQKMMVHELAGAVDHRYERMRGLQTYFAPLGDESTRRLQGIFLQLTDEAQPEQIDLPVQGRVLKIVHAAKGVGFFNFNELCATALGAADYLEIAKCLHTVILDDVPQLTTEKRNETLRFMTLIDALYEAKVKFFMAAAAAPEKLNPGGELSYAFQRTVSRLMEMQGEQYMRLRHADPETAA